MIIGGIGGVCRTGLDGSRTGYRETYIQGLVSGTGDIGRVQTLTFSAKVQILNVAGTADVVIDDVTAFSITLKSGGSSANITIRDVETWGRNSISNPDLLAPSARKLEIIVTCTYAGTDYEFSVFLGFISSYSEAHGRSNSAITLVVNQILDATSGLEYVEIDGGGKTAYAVMREGCREFGFNGAVLMFLPDTEAPDHYEFKTVKFMLWTLFGIVYIRFQNFPGDSVMIESVADADFVVTPPTEFNDDETNVSTTISSGSSAFNTIKVAFFNESNEYEVEYAEDAVDVAKRGTIVGPVVSGTYLQWTKAGLVAYAERLIAQAIYGSITVQTRMNPALHLGKVCSFSCDRMNFSGKAGIEELRISYSRGNASSYAKLTVIP